MREINNITKIGVISDTHLDKYSGPLPSAVMEHFKGVDLIIHCGDIVTLDVITGLETLAPVIAVRGNMDPKNINLAEQEIILINAAHTVCVTHGSGSPFGITHKLYKQFSKYKPSIVLYGHTHVAGETQYNGIRFFNPGSPTTRSEYFSIGMIDISTNELKTTVIVI